MATCGIGFACTGLSDASAAVSHSSSRSLRPPAGPRGHSEPDRAEGTCVGCDIARVLTRCGLKSRPAVSGDSDRSRRPVAPIGANRDDRRYGVGGKADSHPAELGLITTGERQKL